MRQYIEAYRLSFATATTGADSTDLGVKAVAVAVGAAAEDARQVWLENTGLADRMAQWGTEGPPGDGEGGRRAPRRRGAKKKSGEKDEQNVL